MNLKRLCHALVFMAAAAVLCSLFSITAFATSYAEFYIPDGAVAQGSEFEVTVKFTSDQNIGTVQSDFVYDDSSVQFVPDGDMVTGGSGILLINASPDKDSTELSVTLKFTALKKGTSEMSISNCSVLSGDGMPLGSPTAYANITVGDGGGTVTSLPPDSEPTDSVSSTTTTATDENGIPAQGILTRLTVSEGELIPEFSYDIYDYVVKVDSSVDYCEIEGTTASSLDYIWYTGSNYLQVGDNVRTITVTDTNGNKHTYTITIQRAAPPEESSLEETQTQPQSVTTSAKQTTSAKTGGDNEGAMDKYKKILMPALGIVMFVLVLALVILIVWLRTKARERRELKEEEKARRKRRNIQAKKK